jgi:hypothetical protein
MIPKRGSAARCAVVAWPYHHCAENAQGLRPGPYKIRGVAPKSRKLLPEGRRPSAQQTAEPRAAMNIWPLRSLQANKRQFRHFGLKIFSVLNDFHLRTRSEIVVFHVAERDGAAKMWG